MQFINEIANKLLKVTIVEDLDKINIMLDDIKEYLNGRQTFHTNQQLIGYDALFRGYIIKNWLETECNNYYEDYNRIIINYCIRYYYKY